MAAAVHRLARVEEARIHGRADAIRSRQNTSGQQRRRGRSAATTAQDAAPALPDQAAPLWSGLSELLRPRSAAALLRRARVRRQHYRGAVYRAHPTHDPARGRGVDGHLPIHDRSGHRRHDRAFARAEASPRRPRGPGPAGVHRPADRPDHEPSPQRRAPPVFVKRRILALVHEHLVPPEDTTGIDVLEAEWKMEYDVIETLREQGHEVRVLGVHDDLAGIRPTAGFFQPHIVLNLMEAFAGVTTFDQNVVSYLELLRLRYTGCNPRGLIFARDKALSKKLLAYHRIPVPDFSVVRYGRKAVLGKKTRFPLIVK